MSSGIGEDFDVVTLRLNDQVLLRSESYQISTGTLTQPASFAIRAGSGRTTAELLDAGAPNTKFEVRIDDIVQFVGRCDGPTVVGRGSGASEVTIRGRDNLAPLHDTYLEAAVSYTDETYTDLVLDALKHVAPGASFALLTDDTANRKAVTNSSGLNQRGTVRHTSAEEAAIAGLAATRTRAGDAAQGGLERTHTTAEKAALDGLAATASKIANQPIGGPGAKTGSQRTIQGKIGQKWYGGVLKPELDRVGLVLFASADGTAFILVQPDTSQRSIAQLTRRMGQPTIIETWEYKNETTSRYSSCDVHFRAGGDGKQARSKAFGHADDREMIDVWNIPRPMTVQDDKCKSLVQAEFLARRKICEARRANWSLVYTVRGHSTIGYEGSRIYWSNNIMIDVDDEELGIHEPLYLESVEFNRQSGMGTTSKLHFMRPDDMLFGEPEEAIGGTTRGRSRRGR